MSKYKFYKEYELNINPRTLFELISTPIGLDQWFAKTENDKENNKWVFTWDNEAHPARVAYHKIGKAVRFEFEEPGDPKTKDPSYIEFTISQSALTKSVYLSVTDYSEMDDEEDLTELWDDLIHKLKSLSGL
jgi:uncharacterized protein YndB with AHSA1/START domain